MDISKGKLVATIREEYTSGGIDIENLPEDPLRMFENWLGEAIEKLLKLPNAMLLATAGKDCRPSGRILLLRDYDEKGFVFFTSYESRKGIELELNKYAALTFFWNELYRQVRIEGQAYRISPEESDTYFNSRPRENQISSVASRQSRILPDRDSLKNRVREIETHFRGRKISRPPEWGGYRLHPESFEFWQGRENRLHDRVLYSRLEENSNWKIELLYP